MTEKVTAKRFPEQEGALSLAFPALMRKVYVWMTLALTITGITALGIANNATLLQTIFTNQWIFWGLVIAELGLVFAISGAINQLSLTSATLLFVLYSVVNGATLSFVFTAYTGASVAKVFFITAGTFAAMSAIGYTTKTDLSKMGKLLFMALLGIIVATVVNLFMHSSMLDLVISYVGVLIFVGLTAWDTQKIRAMLAQQTDMDEGAQKVALIGALSLYLDFINLFIYLLRILGDRD